MPVQTRSGRIFPISTKSTKKGSQKTAKIAKKSSVKKTLPVAKKTSVKKIAKKKLTEKQSNSLLIRVAKTNPLPKTTDFEKLDFPIAETVDKTNFRGTHVHVSTAVFYFLKKYKHSCMPLGGVKKYRNSIIWKCVVDSEKKCLYKLDIDPLLLKSWQTCAARPNVRFIFGNISLSKPELSHANAFIFDTEDNSVEIFEPNGNMSGFEVDAFYAKITEFFKSRLSVANVFLPGDFCPYASFQKIQSKEKEKQTGDPGGFCQAWSIWWIDYRLRNYAVNFTRSEMVKKALEFLKVHPKSLTSFIRNYSHFIDENTQKLIVKYAKPISKEISVSEKSIDILPDEFGAFEDAMHENKEMLAHPRAVARVVKKKIRSFLKK